MTATTTLDWHSIFLDMPQAIAILDSEGAVLAGNRKLEELMGRGEAEILGKKCWELVHRAQGQAETCPFSRMLKFGKTEAGEVLCEGLGAFCQVSSSPCFDSTGALSFAIHSFTAIDERRKAEGLLRKEEERLRNMIAGTNAGTWELDIPSGELSIDERSAAILGYSLAELQPLTIDGWMRMKHADDREESRQGLAGHLRGETESYSSETRMLQKSGRWVWVHARGKVVEWDARGAPSRMFGTNIDVTERREAEERIKGLLAEKELILKEVHHRIKNNMGTIYSFLKLQTATLKDPSGIASLSDAAARVQSMLVLYDKLYLHSDYVTVSLPLYVPSLVDEIAGNFSNRALVKLVKRIDDISLDIKKAQALGVVINELITNAMKYAFKGMSEGVITVSASLAGGLVRFSVEDNGRGMPETLDFADSGGFGFTLISGLTKQLGGTMRIERKGGTGVFLEFER